jgi:hypothetical protein
VNVIRPAQRAARLAVAFHTNNALVARNFFDFSPTKAKRIHNNGGVTLGGQSFATNCSFSETGYSSGANAQHHLLPRISAGDYRSALGVPLFDSQGRPVNVCTTEGGTTQLRQGMVFDPATGDRTNATGRCVFSHNGQINVMSPSRIAPGSQKFWPRLGAPSISGPVTVNTPYNHSYNQNSSFNRNIGIAKVDWNQTTGTPSGASGTCRTRW